MVISLHAMKPSPRKTLLTRFDFFEIKDPQIRGLAYWIHLLTPLLVVWLFVLPTCLALLCIVQGPRMARILTPIWRVLDRIYTGAGGHE